MRILIPSNLDINEILLETGLSKRVCGGLKSKIYYLISRLVVHHHNQDNFDEDGHIRICRSELQKIFNRHYPVVIRTLKKKGIIHVEKGYTKGITCKKYRLCDEYQNTDIIYKSIQKVKTEKPSETLLLDTFFNDKLTIEGGYKQTLKEIINRVIPHLKTDRETLILKNKLGRWISTINDIENNRYWYKKSSTNYRYNTNITNLSRVLRGNLRYDQSPLIQVDIKSSQIYLLASILNYDFFKSNNPINYQSLTKHIIKSSSTLNPKHYMFSPLMWAHYLKTDLKETISNDFKDHPEFQKFRDADFEGDFYSQLFQLEYDVLPSKEQRYEVKKDVMYVLFQNNRAHRKSILGVYLLRKHYPFVEKSILSIIDHIGPSNFAIILQRFESIMLLDQVVPAFHKVCPDAPIFTIHDSVLTTPEYGNELERVMYDVLYKQTGIKPGLSIEYLESKMEITGEFIQKFVIDIRKKSSDRNFKKMKWSILDQHIQLANQFFN
jgi:hypothetical protein